MKNKKEFKILKPIQKQKDLEEYIIFLADDLKRRAKEIAIDWDKSISEIEIKSILQPNEVLKWEVSKTYTAYKEEKGED